MPISNDKKNSQLSMSFGKASHKLVRDIMFDLLIKDGHKCFRCGGELIRETFSIEHKIPWLDSEDPSKMFFDLGNIAFSHFKCNVGAIRNVRKHKTEEDRAAALKESKKKSKAKWRENTPLEIRRKKRRAYYERTGRQTRRKYFLNKGK